MFVFAVVTDQMAQTLRCTDAHDYVQQIESDLRREKFIVEDIDSKEKRGGEVICCLYFTFSFQ